jgi:hypothetical protein
MRKFTIILEDLTEVEPLEIEVIPPPYDETMDLIDQVRQAYRVLQRSIRIGNRIEILINAFYLGKALEASSYSRPQQAFCRSLLTEHFKVMATRTYYIFEFLGPEQIMRTKKTTASMIRTLPAKDFKKLVMEATRLVVI